MPNSKIKLRHSTLSIGDFTVAQIEDDHIHISLDALEAAGFKGTVRVSDSFTDKPILERRLK